MTKARPGFWLALLTVVGVTLATVLEPRAAKWTTRAQSGGALKILLGDSRRLFASQLFEQADISFHSGYYPSIFDRRDKTKHENLAVGAPEDEEHEKEEDFLGKPSDWIDGFGRHFKIVKHTHLEHGNEREILPWLKLSADLDPKRVETYTVASYWLRNRLGKVAEAEQFLRDGLRANPGSYEILFELGRLLYENRHDANRARNVWKMAMRRWEEQEPGKEKPDNFALEEITVNLARLEKDQGNFDEAIKYFERAKTLSPAPEAIQEQIDALKKEAQPHSPVSAQRQT